MPITLKAAVGKHIRLKQAMRNRPEDVLKVQTLLRVAHHLRGVPSQLIAADGRVGSETLDAIIKVQRDVWQSAEGVVQPGGPTLVSLNQIAANPVVQVLQTGDMSKTDPFTIIFVANPAVEAPWNSGTFMTDPIMSDQQAFDDCVRYACDCLLGNLPGQIEGLLADPEIGPKIRIVSVFQVGLSEADDNALVGQDSVSNLLIARRDVFVPFLARLGLQVDVAYAVSKSASHNRASAWFTSDNDAGPGYNFTLDGVTRSHRFYNLIPGTVALHTTSRSLTPLHEFGHALSSYTNGMVVDLYVDSDTALNNKRGRPIPPQYGNYSGEEIETDFSRDGIGYPSSWQSYHCERLALDVPAVMDNYFLSPRGAEACVHDKVTREFLRDRLLAKLDR
jgi:hypothetical protein